MADDKEAWVVSEEGRPRYYFFTSNPWVIKDDNDRRFFVYDFEENKDV